MHGRGRHEFLRVGRQMPQERIAPRWIELPKNVVDQKKRRRAFFHHEDARLRDLQRERYGALLTLGGVLVCGLRLHENLNVVPMRANHRLPEPRLLRSGVRQVSAQNRHHFPARIRSPDFRRFR